MYINGVPLISTLTHKNLPKPQSQVSVFLISSTAFCTYYFIYMLTILNPTYERNTEFFLPLIGLFHLIYFSLFFINTH